MASKMVRAWEDTPVLELTGPLDGRLEAVLAALKHTRRPDRAWFPEVRPTIHFWSLIPR